jgi:hypothetical protein
MPIPIPCIGQSQNEQLSSLLCRGQLIMKLFGERIRGGAQVGKCRSRHARNTPLIGMFLSASMLRFKCRFPSEKRQRPFLLAMFIHSINMRIALAFSLHP